MNILTGKYTRKTPLGMPGRRWEENIRENLKGIGANRNCADSSRDRNYLRALLKA